MLTPSPKETRVIVGMSGGVDSSVTALLLLQQGYQVEGLFMKNWNDDDGTEYCTAQQDLMDALHVSHQLGIELHTVNFARSYWDNVFDHFLKEYNAGRTPNPDILCNREIKFKAFLDHAKQLGADFIATGHYVRRSSGSPHTQLLRGLDNNKDQSYFLHAVDEQALNQSLFPVGELNKSEVRRLAAEHGLATRDKKDSTGICFIGERKFKDFLERYLPARPGNIHSLDDDTLLGEHNGLMYHTIGQRQGLGIGGVKNANQAPWYVADKDLDKNILYVVQGDQHPALYKTALQATEPCWINGAPAQLNQYNSFDCSAQIRYRQTAQPCRVHRGDQAMTVAFNTPQRAVTPGQSVVFYRGEQCLGGAIIEYGYNADSHLVMDAR